MGLIVILGREGRWRGSRGGGNEHRPESVCVCVSVMEEGGWGMWCVILEGEVLGGVMLGVCFYVVGVAPHGYDQDDSIGYAEFGSSSEGSGTY